jgi:CheY-like chemotaxis protein
MQELDTPNQRVQLPSQAVGRIISARPKLVIVDADACDLAAFKDKYRGAGFSVTAVWVSDRQTRMKYCLPHSQGKINLNAVNRNSRGDKPTHGLRAVDCIASSATELADLLEQLKPEALLTDNTLPLSQKGESVIDAAHASNGLRNIPMVMHTHHLREADPAISANTKAGNAYIRAPKRGTVASDYIKEQLGMMEAVVQISR